MPLHFVHAPTLEPLLDRFADELAANPLGPTQREVVLMAQNNGLRVWLEHRLAERLDCAASLDFRAPLALATQLIRALVPEARPAETGILEADPFDRNALAWRLAACLEALTEDDGAAFSAVRAYLDATGRPMTLAARLASLFDDYQAYRPDLLAAWLRSEAPSALPHADWQAALWCALHTDAALPDRAAALDTLIDRLDHFPRIPHGLPERLTVFGTRLLPPAYYRLLRALSRHLPITVYTVAAGLPDDPYRLAEDGFRHPLLRALGEHTREFVHVLDDLGRPTMEALSAAEPLPTALGRLQHALHTDAPPAEPVDVDDASLRVLDCHSPLRELEVLRDHLLDAFDALPDLRPSDVLVLLPDLPTYAPLVDAVFGAEALAGRTLPYHVAEHPHTPPRRVLDAFARALRLREGRVTVSELLALLSFPAVARRAGIRPEELDPLRRCLHEAGVRWGLDAPDRVTFGLPEDDLHTWRFGLDRLLLGFAMGDGPATLGRVPCDLGLDRAELLGRFAEWADGLVHRLRRLDRRRPLDAWPEPLTAFLDALLDPDDDAELEAVLFLRDRCAELARLHALGVFPDAEASLAAVQSHLEGALGGFEQVEPYLTGGITFAPPFPLRHAPFRVVAFVGLSEGTFPSASTPPAFDLIAAAPRPGDADERRTAKQLFLDAVLAARDRLILSYVGRDERDNSPRAPSIVLDALLDACERHFGAEARDRLVVQHRLQPFDPDYFRTSDTAAPGLFSYAAHHCLPPRTAPVEPTRFVPASLPPGEPVEVLTLAELAEAWLSPGRALVRHRLGLRLGADRATVADDEPVELDGLERFRLRELLFEGLLDGLSEEELLARLVGMGLVPAGAAGEAWLRRTLSEVQPLVDQLAAFGMTAPRALDIEVGGRRLIGSVARWSDRAALHARPGSVREKDLVHAWMAHLAACASGEAAPAACLGTTQREHFRPVPEPDARLLLGGLVRGYDALLNRPPLLFPRASRAMADEVFKYANRDTLARQVIEREAALQAGDERPSFRIEPPRSTYKVEQALNGGWQQPGDRDEDYLRLALRDADATADDAAFRACSIALWAPMRSFHAEGLPA